MAKNPVSLHNIKDSEAWVNTAIFKHAKYDDMTDDLRSELQQQGLLILVNMAKQYDPDRFEGNSADSSFSAFAIRYFPGKIRDAYRKLQGDRLTTDPETGKRAWEHQYCDSLDEMLDTGGEDDEYHSTPSALQYEDEYEPPLEETLQTSIQRVHEEDSANAVAIGQMMSEGVSNGDMQEKLGLRSVEIESAKLLIKRSLRYV